MKTGKFLIEKKSCFLKDLVIPDGYRLLRFSEVAKIVEEGKEKEIIDLLKKDYVFVDFCGRIRMTGFLFLNGEFLINLNNDFYINGRSRGVFVKIKEVLI